MLHTYQRTIETDHGSHLFKLHLSDTLHAFLLLKLLSVKFHLNVLQLGGNHVRWNIGKMLLDFFNFFISQTRGTRFIVHLEELDVLQLFFVLPANRLLLRVEGPFLLKLLFVQVLLIRICGSWRRFEIFIISTLEIVSCFVS